METQTVRIKTHLLHRLAWSGGVPLMLFVYVGGVYLFSLLPNPDGSFREHILQLWEDPLLLGLMAVVWIAGGYFWAFLCIKFSALLTNRTGQSR